MADLTRDDVLRLANLARLNLTDAEVTQFQTEISQILQYVEQLQTVDLDNIAPTNQVTGLVNVMREDKIIDYGASLSDLLANAPAIENNHIKVRKML